MLPLTPEQREIGKDNYYEAVGVTRRDFLKGAAGAGLASGAGLGAAWFGYGKVNDPVRVGVIGVGDEGNVLLGGCSPDYVVVKAIADIRPSSIHRAFHGDWATPAQLTARPGLIKKAGYSSEAEARRNVKVYDASNGGMMALLDDPEIEAVIIALPLFLHAPVAIQAMAKGKHVLTEKLMAWNVAQCKAMARFAKDATPANKDEKFLHLATGHQRHYSVLYDNAVHLMRSGMLGQLHHIRAQWHRNNLPGADSWAVPIPGVPEVVVSKGKRKEVNKIVDRLNSFKRELDATTDPAKVEELTKQIAQWERWNEDAKVDAEKHGYITEKIGESYIRTALEELCRWRLWDRTGGGLMAELGSHQLDASTIFCSALRPDGTKAHPLTVHAVGGRHIFPRDRDAEDHVYCMYEFPGPDYAPEFDVGYARPEDKPVPGYAKDPNKKIVVTYSTINGNGFGGYGEVVMGTKGALVLDRESELMLYKEADVQAKISVKGDKEKGYSIDTQASGSYSAAGSKAKAAVDGPISRGYTEEIEHWAWCIRNQAAENKPRCYPEVAMADAVIALTTNVAMANGAKGEAGFVKFKETWFERDSDETPDGSNVEEEMKKLKEWKLV